MGYNVDMLNSNDQAVFVLIVIIFIFFLHLKTKERLGIDPAKTWRHTLVSAGIALAPETFQTVLDAEGTAKGINASSCLAFDVLAL